MCTLIKQLILGKRCATEAQGDQKIASNNSEQAEGADEQPWQSETAVKPYKQIKTERTHGIKITFESKSKCNFKKAIRKAKTECRLW